jgi:hypothetical protein
MVITPAKSGNNRSSNPKIEKQMSLDCMHMKITRSNCVGCPSTSPFKDEESSEMEIEVLPAGLEILRKYKE